MTKASLLPRFKLRGASLLNVALVAIVLTIATTAYLLFFRPESEAAVRRVQRWPWPVVT